jgi:hypothetical protein
MALTDQFRVQCPKTAATFKPQNDQFCCDPLLLPTSSDPQRSHNVLTIYRIRYCSGFSSNGSSSSGYTNATAVASSSSPVSSLTSIVLRTTCSPPPVRLPHIQLHSLLAANLHLMADLDLNQTNTGQNTFLRV